MDAKKFLELQGQMRQNNQEYQEFVSELDTWKAELERKREKSQAATAGGGGPLAGGGAGELPPVRNSLLKKKLKKKVKKRRPDSEGQQQQQQPQEQLGQQQQGKKISGYDYRAWDKFDVDKACDLVESQAARKSYSSEYETDEDWEEERRKQLAEEKKVAGNEAFKAKRFDEAVEQYSKAAQLNPEEPVYFCNRAMAQLRLERHAAAEADCDAALELDSRMVKAYYRRGQARLKLGKLPEALRDLEEALAMEPANRALQSEVQELRLRLHPERYATGEVKPVLFDKPQAQRSTKPLMRVPIQEVSAAAAAAASAPVASAPAQQRQQPQQQPQPQSSNKVPAEEAGAAQPKPLQVPETPFQYKAVHRSLARRDPLAFCTGVLCAVQPEQLPRLIGESLESDTLLDLVAAFLAGVEAAEEAAAVAERALRCLRLLADRVKRFATCVAFLSASERARVAELMALLWRVLGGGGGGDSRLADDVKSLAAAYGVPAAVGDA